MKEKKALFCCVIVMFLMAALCIAGCSGESNGTGDNKKPDGSQGTNKWPADIPGYVPLPNGDVSEIKEAKRTGEYAQYFIIIFENMKDTADSYEKIIFNSVQRLSPLNVVQLTDRVNSPPFVAAARRTAKFRSRAQIVTLARA